MKPSPAGSSPEACKAAGQGEKSCPVCQAWGGVSGLGSESGPWPGTGAVSGPTTILGPGPGPGAMSGPGPGPGVVLEPGPRPGAASGPGPRPGATPGLGPVRGAVSGPVPESGAVPGPGPGSGAVSRPRPGPGATSGPEPGLGPGSGAGSVPGPVPGPVPRPGAAPLPGPGVEPRPRRGSGTGPKPSEPETAPTPALQQKTQATPVQAPRQKVLVTGGGGYLGFSLGSSLAKSGSSVVLLDLRRPQWELSPGTEFIQADVRDEEALYRAFRGVDCVFHVASYGMSGAEKLQKEQIESINVGGTKLVINVCVRRRVPRLIYTSTVNVVFGGKPIEQGDEDSVPYFPLEKHVDHYSRTKAIADQLTLMANGTPLPGGGTLRTCVLRPPGIYGPEEQRHLPRVAGHIKKRLFMFRFGDRRTQMNWVHVRNLVQAHVLAAEALTAAKGYVASGQAYYINDGESVNLFEWMAPLFEKLGHSQPWIQLPTSWVYLTATVMEYLHLVLKPICSVPPLLTRSEVRSVAVTHTFQIAKARAQLGYTPDKFHFADVVEQYVRTPCSEQARRLGSAWGVHWGLENRVVAAGAGTATGGRPRECCAVRPPGQSPAPARRLVPQPRSCPDPRSDSLRCSCLSSADCRLRSRPWHASSAPRDPSSGPSRPGIVPAAPAPRDRSNRPAQSSLLPRSAGRCAPLAAPRHFRGARPPCTLEHRAASLCQLLWIFAAVASGCGACPPEGGPTPLHLPYNSGCPARPLGNTGIP